MRLDKSQAQVGITFPHHLCHQGDMFDANISATVNTGQTVALSITTPNVTTKFTHLKWAVDCNKAATVIFAKGDTITGGDAVTPINKNDNSLKTYAGTLKKDATRSTPGTTIRTVPIGSATGANKVGGSIRSDVERIMAPNTTYTLVVTAADNSNLISIEFEFYEGGN